MPIPVTLIAGFLGSGKTTLLRRILADPAPSERFAVIVNEFGALGIDGDWILRKDTEQSSVVELANGCICCEIQGDLKEAILRLARFSPGDAEEDSVRGLAKRLLSKVAPGRPAGPTHILIEASGAASPGPAMQTFLVDDELSRRARLGAVVTMAHGEHIESQLRSTAEAGPQVAYADRIVVTHGDHLGEAAMARAIEVLRDVNPLAEVRAGSHGDVNLDWLLARGASGRDGGRDLGRGVGEGTDGPWGQSAHTPGLSSVSLTSTEPVDPGAVRMWLEFLSKRRTCELMRCKGILRARGGGVLLIQGVYQWLEMTLEPAPEQAIPQGERPLGSAPGTSAERASRLVLIGKDLDVEEIKRGWRAIQAAE